MAIITLTGPTCAGKSTIEAQLQALGCGRAISHTTRAPRAGEVDGNQYHFVSPQRFDQLDAEGAFVEKVEFGTNRYGMSKAALDTAYRAGQHVVIVVDPHGAEQILQYAWRQDYKTLAVWVDCGPEEQARRWVSRLAGDMLIGKEAVGPYAERLALMLTDEVRWRRDAFGWFIGSHHSYRYGMKVDNENGKQPSQIAKDILAAV
jgi:guanylate kinase